MRPFAFSSSPVVRSARVEEKRFRALQHPGGLCVFNVWEPRGAAKALPPAPKRRQPAGGRKKTKRQKKESTCVTVVTKCAKNCNHVTCLENKTCSKHAQNMLKICTKHAQNMHKTCTKHAQNMQHYIYCNSKSRLRVYSLPTDKSQPSDSIFINIIVEFKQNKFLAEVDLMDEMVAVF